jgi:hypothetical protein
MTHQGCDRLNLKGIFGDNWEQMCWVQFLSVDEHDGKVIRQQVPDVPMLAEDPTHPSPPQAIPTWRTPIPEEGPDDSMDDDDDMNNENGSPPFFPPAPPPAAPHWRVPMQSGTTRSRTPVNTNNSTSTIRSIHTETTSNTLPEGWHREHNQPGLVPKRMPGPSRGTLKPSTYKFGGASSSTGNSAPFVPGAVSPSAPAGPELPLRDDDDDEAEAF